MLLGMSQNDASIKRNGPGLAAGLAGVLSGAGLTVVLMALTVLLLFFATLDEARYGLEIASRAYFGSLVAIWQYPSEWVGGAFLWRLWLPLPGGPVLALAFAVNLAFAGWRRVGSGGWSLRKAALGVTHLGAAMLVAGYGALLFGAGFSLALVVTGASVAVFGVAAYYFLGLSQAVRDAAPVVVDADEARRGRRRLSSHWLYAVGLGAAGGVFLSTLNSRADLVAIFVGKKVELLPVLFYLVSVLAAYVAWMRGERRAILMRGLAAPLLSAGVAAHTLVLVLMVVIRRLPPAVDLYSTFVFAGWCAALMAYYVERRLKNGVAGVLAAGVASACLGIAFGMGNGFAAGVNPVTASGVWLSLHVATIVFGYGAVLLAVVAANVLLVGGRCRLPVKAETVLDGLLCGALAAGLVFVALGILMGGLWAERAWGRFWGWDPKENAALMLLLWCALTVHARRCGMVRPGGFRVLVALSGLVLGWSWVGTNLMGQGLHAYGATACGAWILAGYAAAQVLIAVAFGARRGR